MSKKNKEDKKITEKSAVKKSAKKLPDNPDSFLAKAKKRGITSAQLQVNVESDPDKYDEKTRKQARLRDTLVNLHKNRKSKQ